MRAALIALALALACACGSDPGSGPGSGSGSGSGSTCNARTDVFPLLCGTSVCHEGAINGLDLLSPGLDARVLDASAAGVNCRDSGLRIVDTQDPDRSLLLLKLTDSPPCGSPMPLGSGPAGLTADQHACIEAFVHDLSGH